MKKGTQMGFQFSVSDNDRKSTQGLLDALSKLLNYNVLADGNKIEFSLPKELIDHGLSDAHYDEEFSVSVSVEIHQVIKKRERS